MAEIASSQVDAASMLVKPYRTGWINRVMNWVDRLSIPYLLFYFVVAVVLIAIVIAIQWTSGATELFRPIFFLMGGAVPYVLGGMHYLDHLASRNLQQLRPTLRATDAEYDQLCYRLTTLPARQTWIVSGFGILLGVFLFLTLPFFAQQQIWQMADTPLSILSVQIFTIINFMFASLGWFHTQHQLQVVSEIHDRYTNVDLYNLKPLYAFSVLSAHSAIIYIIYPYALLAAVPFLLDLDFTRVILSLAVFMVGIGFLLPLLGVHRRLVEEKDRLLLENSRRMERAVTEANQRIDSDHYEKINELNTTLENLERQRTILSRISTWPWKPETVRGVAATILLPLLIWGIQWALEKLMA